MAHIKIAEIGSKLPKPTSARTDFIVFGKCPIANDYNIYQLATQMDEGGFRLDVEKADTTVRGAAFAIGDEKVSEALAYQSRANPNKSGAHILEELIRSGRYPSIGGHVQAIRVDASGARIFPTLHQSAAGNRLRLLNVDVDEIGPVGTCKFDSEAYGLF